MHLNVRKCIWHRYISPGFSYQTEVNLHSKTAETDEILAVNATFFPRANDLRYYNIPTFSSWIRQMWAMVYDLSDGQALDLSVLRCAITVLLI